MAHYRFLIFVSGDCLSIDKIAAAVAAAFELLLAHVAPVSSILAGSLSPLFGPQLPSRIDWILGLSVPRGYAVLVVLPSAAGRTLTRHPCQGAVQQLRVAAGLSLKRLTLRNSRSSTATWVSARSLAKKDSSEQPGGAGVMLQFGKISGLWKAMIHFPRLDYTERENRLNALRFAPMNAQKTRGLDSPPSSLLSCFQLRKTRGEK